MKRRKRETLYHFVCTIPDRLYPFKTKVHGHIVRGLRAYEAVDLFYERKYGRGHYGVKLDAYRQIFHLAGSILFLVSAAYVSHSLLESETALYVFLASAVAFITFQEFYLHRKIYQQLWRKGILDWLAWCVPIGYYVFFYMIR